LRAANHASSVQVKKQPTSDFYQFFQGVRFISHMADPSWVGLRSTHISYAESGNAAEQPGQDGRAMYLDEHGASVITP